MQWFCYPIVRRVTSSVRGSGHVSGHSATAAKVPLGVRPRITRHAHVHHHHGFGHWRAVSLVCVPVGGVVVFVPPFLPPGPWFPGSPVSPGDAPLVGSLPPSGVGPGMPFPGGVAVPGGGVPVADRPVDVPEPAGVAVFGCAVLLLSWLRCRRAPVRADPR